MVEGTWAARGFWSRYFDEDYEGHRRDGVTFRLLLSIFGRMWSCNILAVCVLQKTKALRVATCRGCSAGSQSCGSVWDGWSNTWECNEMQRIKDVPNSCKLYVYTLPHPSFAQWLRATSTPSSSWNANVHSCEPLKALVRINNINIYIDIWYIYINLYSITLQYYILYIHTICRDHNYELCILCSLQWYGITADTRGMHI